MNVRKVSTPELIAAILCFVYTLLRLFRGFSYISFMGGVYMFSFAVIGIGLLSGIYLISAIVLGIDFLLEAIWFVQDIQYGTAWQYLLNDVAFLVAYVLLIVMMIPRIRKSPEKGPLSVIWFLPGALALVGYIPVLIDGSSYYFSRDGILMLLWILVLIAAFFMMGYAATRPAEFRYAQSPYAAQTGAYMGQNAPYGGSAAPYTGQSAPYGGQAAPYTGQTAPYGQAAPTGQTPSAAAYKAPAAAAPQANPAQAAAAAASSAVKAAGPEAIEMLRKYKALLDAGVITQAEFDEQKKKILG